MAVLLEALEESRRRKVVATCMTIPALNVLSELYYQSPRTIESLRGTLEGGGIRGGYSPEAVQFLEEVGMIETSGEKVGLSLLGAGVMSAIKNPETHL